jgi:hypothetical protein
MYLNGSSISCNILLNLHEIRLTVAESIINWVKTDFLKMQPTIQFIRIGQSDRIKKSEK